MSYLQGYWDTAKSSNSFWAECQCADKRLVLATFPWPPPGLPSDTPTRTRHIVFLLEGSNTTPSRSISYEPGHANESEVFLAEARSDGSRANYGKVAPISREQFWTVALEKLFGSNPPKLAPPSSGNAGQSATNLARWKASDEPAAWVRAHLKGWNHQEWLDLLASLGKSRYWPMDESEIGRHLEALRTKLNPAAPTSTATSTTTTISSSSTSTTTSPSVGLEILFSAAHPHLFRKNAFRVTGLAVEATAGEIARHVEKLRMTAKYGGGNRLPSPLPLTPPPDNDLIREAVDRLRDPERRLIDEFFWFWPHKLGDSRDDESLAALRNGDEGKATAIWKKQESGHSVGNVSMHNLAVLMHAKALDSEFPNSGATADWSKRLELWKSAYQRWKILLDDEGFWSRLTSRIRELDDPRLTTGTARRMRSSLPLGLLLINAQLTVRAAEAGKAEDVKQHLAVMKASGFGEAVVQEALRRAVESIRDRIKTLCQAADKETDVHPEAGGTVVTRQLAETKPLLAILDLVLPAADPARIATHDEVAIMALRSQIAFGNKTEQWKKSFELLEAILLIAVSPSARSRIEENLRIVKRNRDSTLCFFCGENEGGKGLGIERKMFGDVNRNPTFKNGRFVTEMTWRKRTITVPRCPRCKAAQGKAAAWTALAIITSILTGIVSCAVAADQPDGDGIAALMLFAFSIVGSIVGSFLARNYYRKNIKPAGHANQYPEIKDQLKAGWQFGTEPVN